MKPKATIDTGQMDIFRSRLDQIIDMMHELVVVAGLIDWGGLAVAFGEIHSDQPGQPPLPVRLMAGLHILKYSFDMSDERTISLYLQNPYFQYFCGEEFFRHDPPLERSSLTRWRQRVGEERVLLLLRESLEVACRSGAARPSNFRRVIVDTTVQPKNIAWPTDAALTYKALKRLVKQGRAAGVSLRQSFARLSRIALKRHQAFAHAKKYDRAGEQLDQPRSYLDRVIQEVGRRIKDGFEVQGTFSETLRIAERVMTQRPRDGAGRHVYAVHAPEVEIIGKGKARCPWEVGVKASVATPINRPKGGQLVVHAMALPGRPHDLKTLEKVLPGIERLTGEPLKRVLADGGYRGAAPPEYQEIVFAKGGKGSAPSAVKNQFPRRNAVEPVIGHMKGEHRMDCNYLAHEQGDAVNVVLAGVGYNFNLLFKWARFNARAQAETIDGHCAARCPS